jgi:Zn-finger nucleic acid-binding protein
MRRVNFARCSGVVIDVCRAHGTWFDRDELHRIVLFIRTGGLELSRERQMAELERERHRLETKRREASDTFASARPGPVQIDLLNLAVGATGGLMNWLLKK